MTDDGTRPAERAGTTGGGDPACWLNRVCEECGAFREDLSAPVCVRCGTPFPGEKAHDAADAPHDRTGGARQPSCRDGGNPLPDAPSSRPGGARAS